MGVALVFFAAKPGDTTSKVKRSTYVVLFSMHIRLFVFGNMNKSLENKQDKNAKEIAAVKDAVIRVAFCENLLKDRLRLKDIEEK